MQPRVRDDARPLRVFAGAILIASAPAAAAQSLIDSFTDATASDFYGAGLALLGDVDGDGVQDIAVSGRAGPDHVRVLSGPTKVPLYTLTNGMEDVFGRSIASVGDLDGDGRDDLIVGAQGSATVFSGATGSVLHTFTSTGPLDVGGGGDATGDGVGDLLVGGNNELRLYDGATGALVRTHPSTAGQWANLGSSPTFFGDVDGDGFDEYAAGAPGVFNFPPNTWVFAYDGASGNLLWSNQGTYTDQLGWALAALGDVDGDGAPDLLASAKQDPGVGCGPCQGKGYVRLLDGATGVTLWQVDGAGFYMGLGYDLAAVGDVDGDGSTDFAAGQPGSLSGCDDPALPVQVRSGASGGVLFEIPWSAVGFGGTLASGDSNGDGWRDLLVAAPCDATSGPNTGLVAVHAVEEPVGSYCTAKVNSQGCTPAMSWTGVASLAASSFRANASAVINQQNGILIWSHAPASIPFQGGTLCLGGTIHRAGPQSSGGNPPPDDCSGSFSFQFTSGYMQASGIGLGDLLHCQYWYRDPAATPASGLTDALQFLVLY